MPKLDFAFMQDKLQNLALFQAKAEAFLRQAFGDAINASSTSGTSSRPLVAFPEFAFEQGQDWGIVFREGALPIVEPYGVLIRYRGDEVVGFEDLSDAQAL